MVQWNDEKCVIIIQTVFPGISAFSVFELLVGHDMKLIQDEIDIFKLQALTEGCLLSEHRHLYSYRSCHLLTVFLLFEMLQSLWLAVKGNCLVLDHYHDKLLGHWQKHFSDKNWLNGILLHMFLISHMGIKFLSFCMLKLKSCLARLNLVGPWLGEEWGRFWLDLRFK